MKTKISHLGRSSVSVILAVMMLLSTMVVGISTVSAVSVKTIYYVNTNKWDAPYAHTWSDPGTHSTWPGDSMDKTNFTYQGYAIYSFDVPDTSRTNIIFSNNGASQTGNLDLPNSGSDKIMYYNGGWVSYETDSSEPTTATDSSAETTQPVTGEYYFWYSTNDNIGQYSVNWKAEPMIKNGSSYYVSNLPANVGSNFYFIVNKNADIPYRNTVWKTKNDVIVDCSTCAGNFSSIGPQERYVPKESDSTQNEPVYFYRISVKTNGSYSFTFDGDKTVKVTEGSIQPTEPTETVKITVPTVNNATVKVTAGGQEYTSGTFGIEVGSSFTVNVTPEKGYKFGNISYNNESYNNGDAITAVKDVTDIKVTVAVDTVNVGFTKLNNATINVSYTDDQATSATAEITADTTLAIQKDTEFTVTVTPVADYELKSIAYGTATSSESPAKFTASADGAVTVTVEQTTPVAETVTVTVPFVENASVAVEYTNDKGAKTTTTITDADADIVMKKDTDFTVTLNVNSGYKCDAITMTYASSSKIVNPATFTASTNGTLTITADISQTSTGEATIKFKSARSYMYKVSMSVNGATATEMTRPDKASTSNDDNFGTSYTGTLTFCWYTQKITVTNGETTTLNFKTSGTKLNAKVSAELEAGKTYYFAVDDIAPSSNTEVTAVELPSGNTMSDQRERNYFHSARHLIYNETAEDRVLGFTNINDQKYMIGQLLDNSNSADALSVVSATAVQKSVTYVEEYSDLQNTLLDANMDGKLDVKDATLIQKAVVGLV